MAPPLSWRAGAARALGLAKGLVTLADAACAPAAAEPHPHRRPLRPRRGSRRPGAAVPRAQACLTPLERRRAPVARGRVAAQR